MVALEDERWQEVVLFQWTAPTWARHDASSPVHGLLTQMPVGYSWSVSARGVLLAEGFGLFIKRTMAKVNHTYDRWDAIVRTQGILGG